MDHLWSPHKLKVFYSGNELCVYCTSERFSARLVVQPTKIQYNTGNRACSDHAECQQACTAALQPVAH